MVSKLLILSVPLVIAICYFSNPYIVGIFKKCFSHLFLIY